MKDKIQRYRRYVIGIGVGIVFFVAICLIGDVLRENRAIKEQQKELIEKKSEAVKQAATAMPTNAPVLQEEITDEEQEREEGTDEGAEIIITATPVPTQTPTLTPTPIPDPVMLPEYAVLYEENPDIIGWLSINGTNVDYPVMQTPEDEEYYLNRDFYGKDNWNGCLLMDTDSTSGVGCKEQEYFGGTRPSTNLIIHGHTMKSGLMFGKLYLYEEENYGKEHNIIQFDSLYEKREYELISVFHSKVYKKSDKVFKYYQFFQADTEDEFSVWYHNIKEMALYDTGVTAQFGDEFITLSCCSEHVADGRLVVVGKRVK